MTEPDSRGPANGILWPGDPLSRSSSSANDTRPIAPGDAGPGGNGPGDGGPGGNGGPGRPPKRHGFLRRRWDRLSRRVKWTAVIVVAGLIFRRAVASLVLMALSAALHFVGISVHLPKIKFGWPWQQITTGTTTNTDIGPWVLQKIEGISRPALGQANFNFFFTHKVNKSLGFLPCWYASTFYAVGHASATVDLNPGPSWWKSSADHYKLQVLRAPATGKPGLAAVTMVLPQPQLPQSANDVTINNIPSTPVSVQHSWTYPGLACGALIRPQFSQSILYSQAQQIAFYRSTHTPQITKPLISSAETEAAQTIRNNFIQPTLNALGYKLNSFTLNWAKS